MSLWTRIANVFRQERLNREIAEELESHIEEAIAVGRDPEEARRALGLAHERRRQRQQGHDARVVPWLDGLRADAVFGWRQLTKHKTTSMAAVLSLALGIGACSAAFRLVEALFLRPLPIHDPERLYAVRLDGFTFQGKPIVWDTMSYPVFVKMREAVAGQAELIAMEPAYRNDITYGSDEAMEKAYVQHVSGWMFAAFGLRPALGRLLSAEDERVPGAEPYAVLSYAYWSSRFGRDPQVIGRSFRMGNDLYRIIGVSERGFTGTEPGKIPDVFVPTVMNVYGVREPGDGWLRVFVRPQAGVAIEPVRQRMYAVYRAFEQERAKAWTNIPKELLVGYPREKVLLRPAGTGVSAMQEDYRVPLTVLSLLVALVLLIACVNVANLITARTTARSRETALRVSIGAGRLRLVQMALTESAILAAFSTLGGVLFAWWAASFVIGSISPADDPVRLVLGADWRVLGFGTLLVFGTTLLFGLGPAWRASMTKPASALKGGDDPVARRRGMDLSISAQAAFCFVVLFLGFLFVGTFRRLSERVLGFDPERLLLLDTVTKQTLPAAAWNGMVERLRSVPGVESVALAGWPLLSGDNYTELISVNGAPPTNVPASFLAVSPTWTETMKIALLDGRQLRAADTSAHSVLVNRAFARQYLDGRDPVGKLFATLGPHGTLFTHEIVGWVEDVAAKDIHEAMPPMVYVPLNSANAFGSSAFGAFENARTLVIRTAMPDASALAPTLRQAIQRSDPGLRVSNVETQMELIRGQTIRERLLATLAAFFAGVALLLAGVGLYGVLSYSVLQREREIGIRIALGARLGSIARLVTSEVFAMVMAGAAAGAALGLAAAKYIEALLYGVKAGDPAILAVPALVLLVAAVLSAAPAVVRAVRIDPATMLRAE